MAIKRSRNRPPRTRARWLVPTALLVLTGAAIAVLFASGTPSGPGQPAAGRPRASLPPHHPGAQPGSAPKPAAESAPARSHSAAAPPPSLSRMLGQMIVARFSGSAPSAALLTRIRAGEVGGVILFSDNVAGGTSATRALTRELQSAAAQGGNPRLLIMADQEGGEVKRLAGPPDLAPADMSSPSTAFAEGAATGRFLRALGINIDLAPVADVEQLAGSFLGTRSFGSRPQTVASLACAFARGLASEGVGYTLKHFPGLGLAVGNTDTEAVSVDASPAALRAGYGAYSACGAAPRSLVMVSSAIYPNLSGPLPAVMSREVYGRELPLAVGGRQPVTISDDLQSVAIAHQAAPARRAIDAGLDLLMYAQSENASADAYAGLLAEARAGVIPRAAILAADHRISELKRVLTG